MSKSSLWTNEVIAAFQIPILSNHTTPKKKKKKNLKNPKYKLLSTLRHWIQRAPSISNHHNHTNTAPPTRHSEHHPPMENPLAIRLTPWLIPTLQALQVAVKLEGDVITSNGSILSGYEGHDGQSLNGSNTSSMCSCHCICLNGNRHKKYVHNCSIQRRAQKIGQFAEHLAALSGWLI